MGCHGRLGCLEVMYTLSVHEVSDLDKVIVLTVHFAIDVAVKVFLCKLIRELFVWEGVG